MKTKEEIEKSVSIVENFAAMLLKLDFEVKFEDLVGEFIELFRVISRLKVA